MRRWMVWLVLVVATASAGVIEPALQGQLARLDGSTKFGVMVVLNEQLDNRAIVTAARTKQDRWEMTVNALEEMSSRTQAGLLAQLRSGEARGKVADIQPMWIVNAVYFEATADVINAVAERPEVKQVEWNLIPTENALGMAAPATQRDATDGTFSVEWNVQKVKADSVWHVYGLTGAGVIVGHIDTGCDYTHSDLADHMWVDPNYPNHGWNFEFNNNDPMDAQGHGTHTAGTVAGDGTAGDSTGMAPNAEIMACRTKTSIGTPYPDTVAENTVMNAMQFCVAPPLSPAHHAQLLTMSLGWIPGWTPRRDVWRQAVSNVATAGVSFFIAAGNEGSSSPPNNLRTPGDCPGPWHNPAEADGGRSGAITIGATDNTDAIASFSSQGPVAWDAVAPFNDYPYPPGLLKPDFSAPGVNVTSCMLGGGYTQMSGTSMATPCAAGVGALILEKNPTLLPEEVDQIMQSSVLPLGSQPKNNTFGTGRIDAMLAIANTPFPGPRHDVAMGQVFAPVDKIDPSAPLAPVVTVQNRGTYDESGITVHCKVESLGTQVYLQNVTVTSLDSAALDTVTFPNWNVGPGIQTYNLTFWHEYSPDTNRTNDTIRKTTVTRGHDVAVAGMNIGGRVRANEALTPRITLRSTDYTEHAFMAWCEIESSDVVIYSDSVNVDSVPAMGSRSFVFPSNWDVGPVGAQYDVAMWHNCPTDENHANDTMSAHPTATDQLRVLWCYSDYGAPDTTLGVRLQALGDSVEYFDVQGATPTLSDLQNYDAVGAHSNYVFADPTGLGDVLADYVDAGGGVVIGDFAFTSGWDMAGRIMTGDYATIAAGANAQAGTTLGWNNSAHPIMNAVGAVGEFYAASAPYAATAESVANWADGRPYVGVSANQRVVGVNSYPGIYGVAERNGDWGLVLHNALAFVAGSVTGVSEFDPTAPALNVRLSATPNPAQAVATLNYMVPNAGSVNLSIYDGSGRLVRTLFAGAARPGLNTIKWNLRGTAGRRVANGVYFCKLVQGEQTQSRKLVVR